MSKISIFPHLIFVIDKFFPKIPLPLWERGGVRGNRRHKNFGKTKLFLIFNKWRFQ